MKNTITVEIRNNYGSPTVYPVCDTAKTFAQIAGTKTLGYNTRDLIKSLGYRITQQASQSVEL